MKEVILAYRLSSVKMESVTRVQILDEALCVSLRTNVLAKGMNISGKIVGQTGFFNFG